MRQRVSSTRQDGWSSRYGRIKFDSSYFEEESNYIDGYKYDETRQAINRQYLSLLRRKFTVKDRIKILDIGCGFGYFLRACDEMSWDTYGLDFEYPLSVAKRFTKAQLICQSANEALSFKDHSLDAVTAFNLIEHLEEPLDFLKEVRRVLRPGGVFFLETPNLNGVGRLLLQGGWTGFLDKTHINLFSPNKLRHLLEEAEFSFIILETRGQPYHPRLRMSVRNVNLANFLVKIWKMCVIPLSLGDHIFAYASYGELL